MEAQIFQSLEKFKQSSQQAISDAHAFLKKCNEVEGFLATLLKIIRDPNVDVIYRQVACISFRDFLVRRWEGKSSAFPPVSPQEKASIKENLLESLVNAPKQIIGHLDDVVKFVLKSEYPDKWPEVDTKIKAFFDSNDQSLINAGLVAYRYILRILSFDKNHERFHSVIELTFPFVLELLKYLMTLQDLQSQEMILLIIKSFASVTQFEIPPYLMDFNKYLPWMECFFQIFEKHLPYTEESMDPQNKCIFSQKKNLGLLFVRYNNRYTRDETDPTVVDFVVNVIAKRFTEISLKTLVGLNRKELYCTERVTAVLLHYLGTCVYKDSLWQFIQPHMSSIFTDIVVPLTCFTNKDLDIFENDPHEWVRLQHDFEQEFYSSRIPALSLILEVIKTRDQNILDLVVEFAVGVFSSFQPTSIESCYLKFAAMDIFGVCSKLLIDNPKYNGSLEEVIVNYIHTDFQNPCLFLKAKAAWVLGKYHSITYGSIQNFQNGLHYVLEAFELDSIPVCIETTYALQRLAVLEPAIPVIRPVVGQLVKRHFDLMNIIDSDRIVESLQALIRVYSEEMGEYSLELIINLSKHFDRLLVDNQDEEVIIFTAMKVIGTIHTVIKSIRERKELFIPVQQCLFPVFIKSLEMGSVEHIDAIIDILTEITYYSQSFIPEVWIIFDNIVKALFTYAPDYIKEMVSLLDNIISFNKEDFLQGNKLEQIFELFKYYVADHKHSEYDSAYACQVIEIVLLQCQGRIDHAVGHFIEVAMNRLPASKNDGFKVFLIEVVTNAIINSPVVALRTLESNGWTSMFLEVIFDFIERDQFVRIHDKRSVVFGLSTILSLQCTLPESITQNMRKIMITLLNLIMQAEEQRINEPDEESDEEEDFGAYAEDLDDDYFDDHDINDFIGSYNDDNSDDWIMKDFEEGELPNDDINESTFFVQSIQTFMETNQCHDFIQQFNENEQAVFHQVVELSKMKEAQRQ